MLDVDLEFRVDISQLYRYFSMFQTEELVGLASDLSPHYMVASTQYRQQYPDTQVRTIQYIQISHLILSKFLISNWNVCTAYQYRLAVRADSRVLTAV